VPTIAARSVLAMTAVALVAAAALTLHRQASRVIGYNGVPPSGFAVVVPVNARVCQDTVSLPERANLIRVTAATFGRRGGRVGVETSNGRGATRRLVAEGLVDLPLPAARSSGVCIANRGTVRVALAGVTTRPSEGARIGARSVRGVVSIEYVTVRSETWGDRTDAILDRVGFAKGLPGGSATGIVLIVLLVGALAGALATAWRAIRP
jgi:hypothetical protein